MGQMVAMQEMIGEISEKSRGDWDGSNGSNARDDRREYASEVVGIGMGEMVAMQEMIGESTRAK